MADTRNYTGVDADAFTCAKDALTVRNVDVPAGNDGELTLRFIPIVKVHFEWDEADALALRIDGKPSFVSDDAVWDIMDSCVLPCGGSVV